MPLNKNTYTLSCLTNALKALVSICLLIIFPEIPLFNYMKELNACNKKWNRKIEKCHESSIKRSMPLEKLDDKQKTRFWLLREGYLSWQLNRVKCKQTKIKKIRRRRLRYIESNLGQQLYMNEKKRKLYVDSIQQRKLWSNPGVLRIRETNMIRRIKWEKETR